MTSLAQTTLRALFLGAAVAACLLLGNPVDAQERRGSAERPRIDVEGTYYRQPQLLERALAELQPSRAGQPQLFFVGFAGYGTQAVFKREALAVRDLFDAQFSTKGRSLVLINHASTMADTALANVSNLERALQHVGGLMNGGDDVLFLFLTSHGQKGQFAVEMPGFNLNDLTPDVLREVLDSSGIKNRVVVVSACHSGSFVEAVAEPNTLVITAAHADRTSFGCDDQREWTYFGDAFFNRALRQERSFERAFQHATQLIGDWEKRDKLTPSLPQIAGGDALRAKLAALAGPGKE
jgi:Peptidase C13 family